MRSIVCVLLLIATPVQAETAYRAISLEGGGDIVLRHGDVARVDFLKGDARHTLIRVVDGKLMVENCRSGCPRGYEMVLAVTAPEIAFLSIRNGGAIEALGAFPEQPTLGAAVSEGGAIDVRAMQPRDLTASVNDGGSIYAVPRASLTAGISRGGHIVYWGDIVVRRSVHDGGVVEPGRSSDLREPLAKLGPELPPIAALPPIPTLPDTVAAH